MSSLRERVLRNQAEGTPVKDLGLSGRGVVYIEGNELIQLISRSSRVLRKDADRFLAIYEAASAREDSTLQGTLLVEKAPICSKARAWLEQQGFLVLKMSP
jgi:hypothetical protein